MRISRIKYLLVIGVSVSAILVSAALPAYASEYSYLGYKVRVAGLNVRTGPDATKYKRVGVIHKNEIYISTGRSKGKWVQIWYDNHKRWIYISYTKPNWYPCVVVKASALNVRTGPGTRYRKVGVVKRNSYWADIGSNSKGSWTKVWYRSEPRWMYNRYLFGPIAMLSDAKPEIEISNVNINNGADWTNSRYVTVQYDSTAAPEYYRISEDLEFSDTNWIKANGSKIGFTLSNKTGNKTIYLQLKNENGRLSNVDSENINYLPKQVK